MKATGITRKIDEMGRFVVPKELRRSMGINEGDSLEIFMNDDHIVLQKYKPNLEKTTVLDKLHEMAASEKDPNVIQTYQRAINLIE